jgi:hypothetical protein
MRSQVLIDEGDILSIHCKMSLMGPKSLRNVDGLSLIIIYFCDSALTPRLNSTEASLQLSLRCVAYIEVSGACVYCRVWETGRNLVVPLLLIPWRRYFTFDRNSRFYLRKKRASKLD